jgi:curved DNA-binding protein CbpA
MFLTASSLIAAAISLPIALAPCKSRLKVTIMPEWWDTVAASAFIDYYETLEISPNANSETIERIFRYFAQRYHPDNRQTGDRARFDVIVEAHNTLRDPVKRARYDIDYRNNANARSKLVDEANDSTTVGQDIDIQRKVLSLLYVRCRQNVGEPGLGNGELESLLGCPAEHLEFHLWYLREKGWIRRTENGYFAITVDGVDRANSEYHRKTTNNWLTDQSKLPRWPA